jgi:hypothetical protein
VIQVDLNKQVKENIIIIIIIDREKDKLLPVLK